MRVGGEWDSAVAGMGFAGTVGAFRGIGTPEQENCAIPGYIRVDIKSSNGLFAPALISSGFKAFGVEVVGESANPVSPLTSAGSL